MVLRAALFLFRRTLPWRPSTVRLYGMTVTTSMATNSNDEARISDSTQSLSPPTPTTLPDEISVTKNKALAEIIRHNYQSLNQTALTIQNIPQTRKSLFLPLEQGPSPHTKAEEHLLHTTATNFLESLDAHHKLCVHGEPIEILKVELKDSKLAICYWSLPFSILADENLSSRDKQIMEFRMHKILTEEGGARLLQRGVHGALRHYYPPRLRLDPAPDNVLLPALQYVLD